MERLQQALLPRTLPQSDLFQIAACYNPVDERADLGGDWYDAFRLPDGRIGLSIGDVTGHGLDAAALMAQCRLALRAYAYDASRHARTVGPGPGARASSTCLLAESPTTELATAIYAIYDPGTGRLRWSRAGHPLPLVCGPVRPGTPRRVHEVVADGGPPLGTRLVDRYPICEMDLPADSFVLFYTDGLVERRGELIDDGIDEVKARLIADDWDALATLCDALTDSVRAGLVREDDVCILALRHDPADGSAAVTVVPTARCSDCGRDAPKVRGAGPVGRSRPGWAPGPRTSRGSAEVRLSNARATGRQPDPARRSRRSPELAEPLDFDVALAAEVESLPELRRSLAAWLAPRGLERGRPGIGPGGDERAGGQRHRGVGSRRPGAGAGPDAATARSRWRSATGPDRDHPVPIPSMADPLAPPGRGLAIVGSLTKDLSLREIDGHTVAIATLRLAPAAKPR